MVCRYDDSGNNTPSLIQNASYTGIRQKQVRKQLRSLSVKCATYLTVRLRSWSESCSSSSSPPCFAILVSTAGQTDLLEIYHDFRWSLQWMLKEQFQIRYNVFLHIIPNPQLIINLPTSFKIVGKGGGGGHRLTARFIHLHLLSIRFFYHHMSKEQEKKKKKFAVNSEKNWGLHQNLPQIIFSNRSGKKKRPNIK